MSQNPPTLYLMCGKIASGKSTLTAKLGEPPKTVVISEDDWLASLYSDQMTTIADYVRCAAKLRKAIGPHVVSLLKTGVSVVLDFPANTIANRRWMREIIDASNADHQLHFLDVPDEVCRERLRARNASGDHAFAASDEQFMQMSKHFIAPGDEEGFNIVVHRPGGTP